MILKLFLILLDVFILSIGVYLAGFIMALPILLIPALSYVLFKKKTYRYLVTIIGFIYGIILLIIAPTYSGGGGYGDLAVSLLATLIFFVSIITIFSIKLSEAKQ